tara:strand:+ start:319 stop:780 length:462 start_codon:yes stop_codon:yes gene_type:complete
LKEYIISEYNQESVETFLTEFRSKLKEGSPLKVTLKSFTEGSLPQKALIHIWIREYASAYFKKPIKALTPDDEEDIKVMLKQKAYKEFGWDFLTKKVTNHDLGISAHVLKSIGDYSKGELYMFMEFVQDYCAAQGVICESVGEYKKLKNESMR